MAEAVPSAYGPAEALEQTLGDPLVDSNPLSFRSTVEHDEREERPDLTALDAAGLGRHYVPAALDGALASHEALFWLLRSVGRRDVTAATSHAVSLPAAVLAWHAGTPAQQARVAEILLGGGQLSIAFHEQEHGNDFMATEVAAEPTATGFSLRGEKWVVANARRSALLVVLARTAAEGGARGFSLVLVDKARIDPSGMEFLERFKTLGVRGQDIDGVRFSDLALPPDALLGAPGSGFELSLKCSQVSRTLSLGPLVGALDTALRSSVAFLDARRLYGEPALAIPAVRAAVVDAFLDILLVECATLACTRAIHAAPDRLVTWAPAGKAFVTETAESALHDLSVLLGARFYLRDAWWQGIFQKIVRDAPLTRVSHFGGVVSLAHLGAALPALYERTAAAADAAGASLAPVFDLGRPLDPADGTRLRLVPHGADPLLLALRTAHERLESGALASETEPVILLGIRSEVARLRTESDALRAFLETLRAPHGPGHGRAPEMLTAARRHAALFAGTAALLFWLESRGGLDDFGKAGAWLHLALRRVRQRLQPALEVRPVEEDTSVSARVMDLFHRDRWFSLLAPPLAARGSRR